MSTQTTRTLFQAAALIGLVLSPASAMAYDFYESCAPTTNHETTLDTADVLIILDKSGSMGGDGDSNGNSKMLLAQQSIEEVSNSTFRDGPCNEMDQSGCDLVRLGLGYFSGGSNVNIIPQERDAGNEDIITDQVYNYSPGGGTYIGKAAKEIHDSNELDDTDRIGIGVIISDGQASSNGTVEQALYYLCEARNRANGPVQTFQVGFGAGADPEMNALFAAAGGTGQCCQGDGCDPSNPASTPFDPCTLPIKSGDRLDATGEGVVSNRDLTSGYSCTGEIQANNAQALKDALLDIIDNVACTFQLDIPPAYPPGSGASEDPEATRVNFFHDVLAPASAMPPVPLDIKYYNSTDPMSDPNAFRNYLISRGVSTSTADEYIGEGWRFSDVGRTAVALTPKLCEEVKSDKVEIVETQVACLCPNTGNDCQVPCDAASQYPSGAETSPTPRPDYIECDENNEFVSGRCKPGSYACLADATVGAYEVCLSDFQPMPDICNGIDDDCDGFTDNLQRADPTQDADDPDDTAARELFEWNEDTTAFDLNGDSENEVSEVGLFCGYESSCVCNQGAHPFGPIPGDGVSANQEWKDLLQTYDDNEDLCGCTMGLRPDEGDGSVDAPAPSMNSADTEAAACATGGLGAGAPGTAGLALTLLGGLIGWRRRRR